MSIENDHWIIVCERVLKHARELHPEDNDAAIRLANHLLGIADLDSLAEKACQIDFLDMALGRNLGS